ncbi:arylacetamide deacetylase-like 4 isoform 2-T2 [Geothlypis trichas]
MASVSTTLAIIGMFFISPVLIPALFWGVVFYDFFNTEVPPGIEQPLKLRVFHSLMITTMVAGKILEKLGICNDLTILRAVLDGIPPWRDSKLLIKDLTVDEEPLKEFAAIWPKNATQWLCLLGTVWLLNTPTQGNILTVSVPPYTS